MHFILLLALIGAPALGPRERPLLTTDTTASVLVARPVLAPREGGDTLRRRPVAIEYSDWYARRLTIHRIGSYTMLPLFGYEYYLGDLLLNGTSVPGWVKPTHAAVAGGIGALFAINTVTGVWNLWDARRDPAGRTRRIAHSALMLAADAGFALTPLLAPDDDGDFQANARRHRNVALGSMALSTVGAAMMWFWRD